MQPPVFSSPSSERNDATTSGKDNDNVGLAIVSIALQGAVLSVGTYLIVGWLARKFQEDTMGRPGNSQAVQRLVDILRRRGLKKMPALSSYEQSMAEDVVDPATLETEFKDIGGLDEIKQELWQLAVLPLKRPDLFSNNSLVQPPKGILLYGKPGTG